MANTLNVSMSEEDWVKVLNMLATFPFKDIAPIIQQLQQQLQVQIEQAKRDQGQLNMPMAKPNGTEAHAPGA